MTPEARDVVVRAEQRDEAEEEFYVRKILEFLKKSEEHERRNCRAPSQQDAEAGFANIRLI